MGHVNDQPRGSKILTCAPHVLESALQGLLAVLIGILLVYKWRGEETHWFGLVNQRVHDESRQPEIRARKTCNRTARRVLQVERA